MDKFFPYKEREGQLYRLWEEAGVFNAKIDPAKPPFCVVMPPPNVTGILHMGHVLDNLSQDIMTRWHRMRGYCALWVPGTDHAGIATQNVVKRALLKEGINPESLGREGFIKKVWEWKEKHGNIIIQQLKRLGCTCDWSRERFTMDEGLSRAVRCAFVEYYHRGLIYRGKRMINWCPVCKTALANDEVFHKERDFYLWYVKYPLVDSDDYIVIATTRPETIPADTAIAVNPNDKRYSSLVGKHAIVPIGGRKVPIIADAYIDPEFGTGALKVTPGHDVNDYEIGVRHNLDIITVITENGKMSEEAGAKLAGLTREEGRERVVEMLKEQGLLEKVEDYKQSVGTCYRCESVIEPMLSEQWFVKMKPLAEKAKKAVQQGLIKIIPKSEEHDFYSWMDNVQDWCISRQLWWGHRIPVFYCNDCGNEMCQMEDPKACTKCRSDNIKQDEDVLDTWFSSQLWPFSTLGWPEKTKELEYWFPTSWLMSGRDILFFWDARMIMSSLELTGDVPFRVLALHGLVRDKHGRKLSKSLGNSPDPLDLFDQYGTDSIRAAIALSYPLGRLDARLGDQHYKQGRSFVTKLWNAGRLLISRAEETDTRFILPNEFKPASSIDAPHAWISARIGTALKQHDSYLEESDFAHAISALYSLFWHDFCDWYLEIIKNRLYDQDLAQTTLKYAITAFAQILKMLHLYMPFVTEELWQILSKKTVEMDTQNGVLALSLWPRSDMFIEDDSIQDDFGIIFDIIRSIRTVRQSLGVEQKCPVEAKVALHNTETAQRIVELTKGFSSSLERLANANSIRFADVNSQERGYVPIDFAEGTTFVFLPEGFNLASAKERVSKALDRCETALESKKKRLNSKDFIEKAPSDVVKALTEETKALEHNAQNLRKFMNYL